MRNASREHFRRPVEFDIEEAQTSSDKEDQVGVYAGVIDAWKRLVVKQNAEKAKLRPYITGLSLLLWTTWIVVGLIRCILAGDTSLLIGSSLWLIPISAVFKFYFG